MLMILSVRHGSSFQVADRRRRRRLYLDLHKARLLLRLLSQPTVTKYTFKGLLLLLLPCEVSTLLHILISRCARPFLFVILKCVIYPVSPLLFRLQSAMSIILDVISYSTLKKNKRISVSENKSLFGYRRQTTKKKRKWFHLNKQLNRRRKRKGYGQSPGERERERADNCFFFFKSTHFGTNWKAGG